MSGLAIYPYSIIPPSFSSEGAGGQGGTLILLPRVATLPPIFFEAFNYVSKFFPILHQSFVSVFIAVHRDSKGNAQDGDEGQQVLARIPQGKKRCGAND